MPAVGASRWPPCSSLPCWRCCCGSTAPRTPRHMAIGAAGVRGAPGLDPEDAPAPSAGTAERWLASLPSEPAMVRVGTRAAVMGLEDRIAQVDDLLTATGDAAECA